MFYLALLQLLTALLPGLIAYQVVLVKLKATLRSAKAQTFQALQQALGQIVSEETSKSNAIA